MRSPNDDISILHNADYMYSAFMRHIESGEKDKALIMGEDLISKFPNSKEAKWTRREIDKIINPHLKYERGIRNGLWASIILAALPLIFLIVFRSPSYFAFTIINGLIFVAIAYGIHKKKMIAAVLGFSIVIIYLVVSFISNLDASIEHPGRFIFHAVLLLLFLDSIRGIKSLKKAHVRSMKTPDEIRGILSRNSEALRERFAVRRLGLFGSFARGEQSDASDLDVLVEFDSPVDFFKFIELSEHLEALTGMKVDLVTQGALKPHIGRRILSEVSYL